MSVLSSKNSVIQLAGAVFLVGIFVAIGYFFPILRIGVAGGLPVAMYVLLKRLYFQEKVFPATWEDYSKKDFFVFFALVAVACSLMFFYRFLEWIFSP